MKDGIIPDVLTDQTSAHDPVYGYVPNGLSLDEAEELRKKDPKAYKERSLKSMARHVGFMLEMQKRGAKTFDYGNNLREFARQGGEANAFDFKGFVPEYIRPQFCEGKGPFRWAALSGDPEDIYITDQALMEAFPENEAHDSLAESSQREGCFPGPSLPHLLAGHGRTRKSRLNF